MPAMGRNYIRHTMGQDWGGRRADNPKDAPKVTGKMVEQRAAELGMSVKREGPGWSMWLVQRPGDCWRNLGPTNFKALTSLNWIAEGGWDRIPLKPTAA